jgi:hypothetical protein
MHLIRREAIGLGKPQEVRIVFQYPGCCVLSSLDILKMPGSGISLSLGSLAVSRHVFFTLFLLCFT